MKIKLDAPLRTLKGAPFQQPTKDGTGAEDWNCDLREVIYGALTGAVQTDRNSSVADKMKVHRLARVVLEAPPIASLTVEDVTLIKERASQIYGVHLFGQMADLLEGADEKAPAPT